MRGWVGPRTSMELRKNYSLRQKQATYSYMGKLVNWSENWELQRVSGSYTIKNIYFIYVNIFILSNNLFNFVSYMEKLVNWSENWELQRVRGSYTIKNIYFIYLNIFILSNNLLNFICLFTGLFPLTNAVTVCLKLSNDSMIGGKGCGWALSWCSVIRSEALRQPASGRQTRPYSHPLGRDSRFVLSCSHSIGLARASLLD